MQPYWWLPVLLFLLLCQVGHGQDLHIPEQPPSIESSLESLSGNLARLKKLLQERKIALTEARSQLESLREELETLQTHLNQSQLETQRLTDLLASSRETSESLQNSLDQIERELLLWRVTTVAGVVATIFALIF